MGSVNVMGNTDSLKILQGEDKIKWVDGVTVLDSAQVR